MKFQSYGREPGRTVAFANSNLILLSDRLLLSCFLFFVSFFLVLRNHLHGCLKIVSCLKSCKKKFLSLFLFSLRASQSQQWKYRNNMWNLFKVSNKSTKATPVLTKWFHIFFCCFHNWSDYWQVKAGWGKIYLCSYTLYLPLAAYHSRCKYYLHCMHNTLLISIRRLYTIKRASP